MQKIKTILLLCLSTTLYFTANAQKIQNFTENFETQSGIYGYVKLSTKPTTFGGSYITIQQDAVVVQGIRTSNKNFNGNDLSAQGLSFPFNCSNCFFYADGEASMVLNGSVYYGKFNTGGTINSGALGKTDQSVKFTKVAIDIHNKIREETGRMSWNEFGFVQSINISKVKGSDFGDITRAVNNYYAEIRKEEERLARIEQEKEKEKQAKEREAKESLKEKEKQNRENSKEINTEQKRGEKNGFDSRQAATNSYNNGIDLAQSMRDEANNMNVQYRFEQDYKDDLLKRADELERNLIDPNQAPIGNPFNTSEYEARSSAANQANDELIAAGAASAISLLVMLGGVIYFPIC